MMSRFQKFMANNANMLSQAITQRHLERARVTIDKDLFNEGFVPYQTRKFPKWVNQFVDAQIKRQDDLIKLNNRKSV